MSDGKTHLVVDSNPAALPQVGRKYRGVDFDALLDLVTGIRGVPESEEVALAALAFSYAPTPAEYETFIRDQLQSLHSTRAWKVVSGESTEEIDREIVALADDADLMLRPRIWVTPEGPGGSGRHFVNFDDYTVGALKGLRLSAFLVQTMEVLTTAGVPEISRPPSGDIGEEEETPAAVDIVNALLDLIGLRPTKRSTHHAGDTHPHDAEFGTRNREALVRQYRRAAKERANSKLMVRLVPQGELLPVRYPTPGEWRETVSLVYPGEHAVHAASFIGPRVDLFDRTVVWIPMPAPLV